MDPVCEVFFFSFFFWGYLLQNYLNSVFEWLLIDDWWNSKSLCLLRITLPITLVEISLLYSNLFHSWTINQVSLYIILSNFPITFLYFTQEPGKGERHQVFYFRLWGSYSKHLCTKIVIHQKIHIHTCSILITNILEDNHNRELLSCTHANTHTFTNTYSYMSS